MKNNLTIQTICWDIQAANLAQANSWQDHISVFSNSHMPAILERIMAPYHQREQTICIPELTLELSEISDPGKLAQSFEDALVQALEEEKLDVVSSQANFKTGAEKYDLLQQLLHYLEYQQLPWYASEALFDAEELLLEELKQLEPAVLCKALAVLADDESVLVRLLRLFRQDEARMQIVIHIASKHLYSRTYLQFLKIISSLSQHFQNPVGFLEVVYSIWLQQLLLNTAMPDATHMQQLLEKVLRKAGVLAGFDKLKDEFKRLAAKESTDTGTFAEQWFYQAVCSIARDGVTTQPVLSELIKEPTKSTQAEEASLFIQNAGIVLLYPYLKNLFSRKGFIQETEFVSHLHQARGIRMLETIACGHSNFKEYHLLLDKILCGWDPEVLLAAEDDVTITQLEADEFLLQCLQQWNRSGMVSARAFRQSFLMRRGRLTNEQTHWLLVVEKKGWDLVMKTLHYPVSVIRLPWMKKPLYVEW